jgi:hypothetical protein
MFNRKIQVDLVKKQKEETAERNSEEFAKKMSITKIHLKEIVRNVAGGVALYVLLDTVRQVMIENAKHTNV